MLNTFTSFRIASDLVMRKEVFSFLLMKMEELDLVERQQEWRTKYVQLTKKGQDLFNEVTPLQERVQAEYFSALNKEHSC